MHEKKRELNEKTKDLSELLEKAFEQEKLAYDAIHPSYNSRTKRNDDEILFITCYVEKMKPYGIHIDNRLEENGWVIDIVIMNDDENNKIKVNQLLKSFKTQEYNGECHGEFAGHIKIESYPNNVSLETIKELNIKLLRLFQ